MPQLRSENTTLPNYPFRVEIEVNSICNLSCVYCYAKPFSNLTPPLSDIKYIFKKTKEEADPFDIIILGGEPFLRHDIIELFQSAMDIFESKRVGVSTNGTLLSSLSSSSLEELKKMVYRGFSIQVTLDSTNSEINNLVRGKTEKTLEGLKTLEQYEIPFIVGIVLTKANDKDALSTVRKIALDYNFVKHINLEPLQPTQVLGKDYFRLHLDNDKMRKIYYNSRALMVELGREDIQISGVVENCEKIEGKGQPLLNSYGLATCLAGLTRAGVFVDGSVTPCTNLRNVVIGNLYRESWSEIWNRSKERFAGLDIKGNQCQINEENSDIANRIEMGRLHDILRDKNVEKSKARSRA